MFIVASSKDGKKFKRTFDQLNKRCNNTLDEAFYSSAFTNHLIVMPDENIYVDRLED